MPKEPAFRVDGLKDLQRELKAAGPEWPKELRRANKEAAEVVVPDARSRALTSGGVTAKAAPSIKAAAEQRAAKIVVSSAGQFPFALGAFLGARRFRQFGPWVGNDWVPGGPGGPFAINAAVRDNEDEILDVYEKALDRLIGGAFPNGKKVG